MARCRCRTLRCVCLLFVLLGNLFIYVTFTVCRAMTESPARPVVNDRFVALGLNKSSAVAPHPMRPFWDHHPDGGAFWNKLQISRDRRRNPILRGTKALSEDAEESALPPAGTECSWPLGLSLRPPNFEKWPKQIQEFVVSMHCREYPLLLDQPETCGSEGKEETMLLLAIKSQEGNFENRQAIRQTWGRDGWVKGLNGSGGLVRRVFLLGKQDASAGPFADVSDLLTLEKGRYRDILQWDFQDTFFNLTLKDVLFWHWFSRRCPTARFVFKGDDDVFLRTPVFLDALAEEEQRPGWVRKVSDFIAGDVIKNAIPLRDGRNKYYIPKTFYHGVYPTYAGGGGIVYSGALALRLKRVSKRVNLFPIDDVYLGMCLQQLGIYPFHHPGFLTFDFPKRVIKPCSYFSILLVHKRTPKEMIKLWRELKVPQPACVNNVKSFHEEPVTRIPVTPSLTLRNPLPNLLPLF